MTNAKTKPFTKIKIISSQLNHNSRTFVCTYVSNVDEVSSCFLSNSCSCLWPSDINSSPSVGPSNSSLDLSEWVEPAVEWVEPPGTGGPSTLAALAALDRDWIRARLR